MPAFVSILFAAAIAGSHVEVSLASGISLRVDGDSSLHPWSCAAQRIEMSIETDATTAYQLLESPAASVRRLDVGVPVEAIECGDGMMNGKMRDALRQEQFPYIRFHLSAIEPLPGAASDGATRMKAKGTLTIAGQSREVTMAVHARLEEANAILRIKGSLPLQMTSYGVDPPSALFGALKTKDQVVVKFDVRAALRTTLAGAASQ